ncbi:hypothetical protein MHPYR_190114 [uncultured Mycobacterium sp.]|uniref:Uncharacterized protein n=1 Tax=uncultured Mycobacterium sp. TaxID=171292 RepID=A0A1Y5PAC2_9MYCO|nr:hypothetical protein MHPYR_190114 [uncultured Mycobacterium sp.]
MLQFSKNFSALRLINFERLSAYPLLTNVEIRSTYPNRERRQIAHQNGDKVIQPATEVSERYKRQRTVVCSYCRHRRLSQVTPQ